MVIEIDKLIVRYKLYKNILLCFVDILELEIIDVLIKVFCLL